MTTVHRLNAVIEREGGAYVALCPELDIASQGETIEESRGNLKEALAHISQIKPCRVCRNQEARHQI